MFQHDAVRLMRDALKSHSWGPEWLEVPDSLGLRFQHDTSASEVIITEEGRLVVTSERYLVQPVAFDIRGDQKLDDEIIVLMLGLTEGLNNTLLRVLSVDELKFAV